MITREFGNERNKKKKEIRNYLACSLRLKDKQC